MKSIPQIILETAAAKAVVQGSDHRHRIIEFYSVLIREARREFNEDNKYTLDSFLTECHNEALKQVDIPPSF
ncbi:hypothetical protein DRQ53_08625 [bacterium]|nr:MAG: hypothetical protein DRQ53_08625 [bacterium]